MPAISAGELLEKMAGNREDIVRTIPQALLTNYQRDQGDRFLTLFDPRGEPDCLTYQALLDRAAAWTALYRLRGLRKGDRIVVILQHSVDLYAAYTNRSFWQV